MLFLSLLILYVSLLPFFGLGVFLEKMHKLMLLLSHGFARNKGFRYEV